MEIIFLVILFVFLLIIVAVISLNRYVLHQMMLLTARHIVKVTTLKEAKAVFYLFEKHKDNILINNAHPESFFIDMGTSIEKCQHYSWHCNTLSIRGSNINIEYKFTNPIVFYWTAWKLDSLRDDAKKNANHIIKSTCNNDDGEILYVTDDFDFNNYLYSRISLIKPINTK